jgi:phosphomannomutase
MFLLFDVDGTLTVPRNPIGDKMKEMLYLLKQKGHTIACVSGSDLPKLKEQLLDSIEYFDLVFSQNGLASYRNENNTLIPFHTQSILKHLGEEVYGHLVNTVLNILSLIKLPIKRSHFIELRSGLLNICPIGRECSQQEREEFEQYDKIHHIREEIVSELKLKLPHLALRYSIGGQISIDVFPEGWDKTYCLQFIPKDTHIYFFGDRIFQGGNDYELAIHPRVNAMKVENCGETYYLLEKILERIN